MRALAIVAVAGTTCTACALVADLGERRELAPLDAGGSPDASPAPKQTPSAVVEATGRLLHPGGASCTAMLVGPSTIVTAASCFPQFAHGCASADDALAGWQFALGDEVRELDGLFVSPLAYPKLAGCGSRCDADNAADVDAGVRRSHDVALVHLRDKSGKKPARLLTRLDDPVAVDGRATVHTWYDLARLGFPSSTSASIALWSGDGFTLDRASLGNEPLHACELRPMCVAPTTPLECPLDTAVYNVDGKDPQYEAIMLRLRAPTGAAPGVALGVARAAPVVIDASSFPSTPALDRGDVAVGIVVETANFGGGGEILAAPLFGDEIGALLDARIGDFDGDCVPDDRDAQPTVPDAAACSSLPSLWTMRDLFAKWNDPLAVPLNAFLPPAVATWGPGRLDFYVRMLDHTTHHLACNSGSSCRAWENLRGELRDGMAASSGGPEHQVFAGIGMDGKVWRRIYDEVHGWNGWNPASSISAIGAPTIVAIDKASSEVWLRRGSTLWRARAPGPSTWLDAEDTGVEVTSEPCAVIVRDGASSHIEVVARGTEKQGFGLVRLVIGPGAPIESRTVTLVPLSLAGAPACAAPDASRLDVFVRGPLSTLLHTTIRGTNASPFEDLGPITSRPNATSWGPGRLDVVARGSHGEVLHWSKQE